LSVRNAASPFVAAIEPQAIRESFATHDAPCLVDIGERVKVFMGIRI